MSTNPSGTVDAPVVWSTWYRLSSRLIRIRQSLTPGGNQIWVAASVKVVDVEDLKIVNWVSYDEADKYPEAPYNHELVLLDTLKREGYIICGDTHQRQCCPIFSDGTTLRYSFRAWGALMAYARNQVENQHKYDYMDVYMACVAAEDEVLPARAVVAEDSDYVVAESTTL